MWGCRRPLFRPRPLQGAPPAPQSIADFEGLLLGVLPGSIPGSGRSSGEGTGYPLQCSWASLVAQLVKNPPAMRETCIRSLGRQDPLEKGKATHFSILAWSHEVAKSRTRLSDFHVTHCLGSRRPATFSPPPPPLRVAGPCRRRASAAPWCRDGEVPDVARFYGWFRLFFVFYSLSCCFCQRIVGRSHVGVHGGLSRILNSVFSPQLLVSLEHKVLR